MNSDTRIPLALRSSSPPSGDDAPADGGQIGLGHLVNVFHRHRALIIGVMAAILALTGISVATQTRMYEATATLRMDIPVGSDGAERAVPTAESEMQIETETRTLASHDFATAMVRDLELLDNPAFSHRKMSRGRTLRASRSRIDKAADTLLRMVLVQRVPHTQLINVSIQSPHPTFAAMLANRYVQVRQMHGAMDRLQRQDRIVAAIADRTRIAGGELRKAEQAVADFRRENHMLVGAAGPTDLAGLNQLAADTATAASLRAGASAKAAGVGVAAQTRGSGAESASSPLLSTLQQRYAELLQRKAELSTFYGSGHPSLANVIAQIAEVKQNLDAEQERVRHATSVDAASEAAHETYLARSDAQSAAAREGILKGYLGALTSKAYENTAANVRLAELERTAETQRALYVGLAARLKQLGSALVSGTGLVLQSTAPTPSVPIRPTPRKTLTIALLGSAILGFASAFALEMTDRRLRSGEQIWRLFGLHTLAMIPLLRSEINRSTADAMIRERPASLFAETAGTLYSEILRRRHGPGAQVVLITSPLPGDGKTSVAHSLGAVAIAAGQNAVVVDLDLRRTSSPDAEHGKTTDLSAYLNGQSPIAGLLPSAGESSSRALTVFSAHGPTRDPGAVISSSQLTRLFEELRASVDLVIIDAPPVLAVRDASNIVSLADMTLLVVRWGRTRIDEVSKALAALREPVNGIVLNAVDYPRHAQGRYGDAAQYFGRTRAYYQDDDELTRPGILQRIMRNFAWPVISRR